MAEISLKLPNIFVLGLQDKSVINLIEEIIDFQQEPASASDSKNYEWIIDNKYYTAVVNFCILKNVQDLNYPLLKTGEAIVIYIDPSKESVVCELDYILSYLGKEQCQFAVQLLIVDGFNENEVSGKCEGLSKSEAQSWCIEHEYELIELGLYPDTLTDSEDEQDDGFSDAKNMGLERVKQALNAHTWSNLKLKSGDDDVEEDNFSLLFSSLGDMKIKAASLPPEERKSYAEKMAIAFWQSLGGDEEEIKDLDSD